MNGAKIMLIGRLTNDPNELKYTSNNGVPYTTISVAVNEYRGPNRPPETNYYNLTLWRRQAENLVNRCRKGQKVLIQGTLRPREYKRQDGSNAVSLDVDVQDFEHMFDKIGGAQPDQGAQGGPAENKTATAEPAPDAGQPDAAAQTVPPDRAPQPESPPFEPVEPGDPF